MRGVLWEVGLADFIVVTLILGGGAAFLAGRATANGWQPAWQAVLWMIPLAGAVRFFHFAFFHGTLIAPQFFVVDLIVLVLATLFGHRLSLARRMAAGYPWIVARKGLLSWALRHDQD